VQDDGIGLEGGAHDGFGHTLLRTLAQRLKAEMATRTDQGTRTTFRIPWKQHGEATAHPGGGG
jgi:two-component sensor histidine kinase